MALVVCRRWDRSNKMGGMDIRRRMLCCRRRHLRRRWVVATTTASTETLVPITSTTTTTTIIVESYDNCNGMQPAVSMPILGFTVNITIQITILPPLLQHRTMTTTMTILPFLGGNDHPPPPLTVVTDDTSPSIPSPHSNPHCPPTTTPQY